MLLIGSSWRHHGWRTAHMLSFSWRRRMRCWSRYATGLLVLVVVRVLVVGGVLMVGWGLVVIVAIIVVVVVVLGVFRTVVVVGVFVVAVVARGIVVGAGLAGAMLFSIMRATHGRC